MDTQNTSRQFRYLEEVRIPLHRAGFETLPFPSLVWHVHPAVQKSEGLEKGKPS